MAESGKKRRRKGDMIDNGGSSDTYFDMAGT